MGKADVLALSALCCLSAERHIPKGWHQVQINSGWHQRGCAVRQTADIDELRKTRRKDLKQRDQSISDIANQIPTK
jgi:hypothetical protein